VLWIDTGVIQGSRDQSLFDGFSGLIAVFHALPRLLAPRHPPHALSSLAALIASKSRCRHRPREQARRATVPSCCYTRWGVTILDLSLLRAHAEIVVHKHAQETVSRPRTACGMQLLPLPNCQRTNAWSDNPLADCRFFLALELEADCCKKGSPRLSASC
jgi:hypothetical protein